MASSSFFCSGVKNLPDPPFALSPPFPIFTFPLTHASLLFHTFLEPGVFSFLFFSSFLSFLLYGDFSRSPLPPTLSRSSLCSPLPSILLCYSSGLCQSSSSSHLDSKMYIKVQPHPHSTDIWHLTDKVS